MSINDRRQIAFLSLIIGFVDMGYFSNEDRDIIREIADKGLDLFGYLTKNEHKQILEFYGILEKETAGVIVSNHLDVVSYGVLSAICDVYINKLKNIDKLEVWQRLSDIADDYLQKKIIYTELDKSVHFIDLANSLLTKI